MCIGTCLSVSPGDVLTCLNSSFRVSFKIKNGENAIETGLMCSLAVVVSLLVCITRRIVFKETKVVV